MARPALLFLALATPAVGGPAPWTAYQVWLWTFGDRDLTPAWLQGLRRWGITGLNREGRAAAAPLRAAGLTFYVGHAAGKGVLALPEESFRRVWEGYARKRRPGLLVRPRCLRDPAVRAELRRRLAAVVKAQGEAGPWAYSLGDEIAVTRRVTPLDFCFSPHCLAAFRAFLRKRYGSLPALNRAWRTRFARWEEVRPFTADEIKRRERRMPPRRWVLAPWGDHREFMDRTFAETLAWLRRQMRRLGVAAPVGFLGGQAPAPYGGYDWSLLVRVVDWVEVYDEGGAMEVVRGLAPHLWRVRTYFPSGGGEGRNRYRLWKYFAHGEVGAILWNDRTAFGPDGRPTSFLRGLAPVLGTLRSAAARPLLRLPVAHDGVALLYSQASLRYAWMRDSRRDGSRWLRRFGSYEEEHASAYEARITWHYLLEAAGYQYRYVDVRRLAREGTPAAVRVLVVPGWAVFRPDEVEALRAFLRRGGTLILDRPCPDLESLLDARGVRVFARPRGLLGRPAARRRAAATLAKLLRAAGLTPPCRVLDRGGEPGRFEVLRRPAADGVYYFVLPLLTPGEEAARPAAAWSAPEPATVVFPRAVRGRNVFAPGTWTGSRHTHPVAPDRPWVFFVAAP